MPNTTLSVEPPDEYLREIGRIVVSWNRLESLILHTLIIAMLGDFAEDGKPVATLVHMAFPQKLDALSAVLRIANEALAQEYRENVQGLLKEAQTKRNAAVHQSWYWEPDGVKRLDIRARGALKVELTPVRLQELIDVAPFIDSVNDKFLRDVYFRLIAKDDPQQGQ